MQDFLESRNIQLRLLFLWCILGIFILVILDTVFEFFWNFSFVSHIIVLILSSTGLVLTTAVLFLKRKQRMFEEESRSIIDPLLLLQTRGINLYDLLEECNQIAMLAISNSEEILDDIDALNKKVQQSNEEIGKIFVIASSLAMEEVKLMDAFGVSTNEMNTMFEIIEAVIFEIDAKSENMQSMVNLGKDGQKKVSDTYDALDRMSKNTEGIMKLIDFINKVSKETNLLSINAAIEAAHSGDKGKGFAVIADEIKKLADETSINSKKIGDILRTNFHDFKEVRVLSKESGDSFNTISSEIHVVMGTIAEVVQTISELKNRGSDIIRKAETLSAIADTLKSSSGEVYGQVASVNDLIQEVVELSEHVNDKAKWIEGSQRNLADVTSKFIEKINSIHIQTDQNLDSRKKLF